MPKTTGYDPSSPLPAFTPDLEQGLRRRHAELKKRERSWKSSDQADRVERFEMLLIEQIHAAAARDPLKTAGEAWAVVAFRCPLVVGFDEDSLEYSRLQYAFSLAVDNLVDYLTRPGS